MDYAKEQEIEDRYGDMAERPLFNLGVHGDGERVGAIKLGSHETGCFTSVALHNEWIQAFRVGFVDRLVSKTASFLDHGNIVYLLGVAQNSRP